MDPKTDAGLAFLFEKQIEEADLACFSKTDRYSEFPPLPGCSPRFLSSQTGDGVSAWLDDILGGGVFPGGKILEIDYERYARAEAALAWLNCSATVELATPASPASLAGSLLEGLEAALTAKGFTIAHLKVMDTSPGGWVKASIVRNGGEPSVQGNMDASPAVAHELLLNARAAGNLAYALAGDPPCYSPLLTGGFNDELRAHPYHGRARGRGSIVNRERPTGRRSRRAGRSHSSLTGSVGGQTRHVSRSRA
jgi:hypothetical protein